MPAPRKTIESLPVDASGIPLLRCSSCDEKKQIVKFNKENRSYIGYQTKCKECEREYRITNKDRIQKYFDENKELIALQRKEYYRRNRDRITSWRRNYYSSSGHLRIKLANAERRAIKISTSDGSVTESFIQLLFLAQNGRCNWCDKAFLDEKNSFHIDHINPLAKGGKHIAENIQLLCPKCNLEKGTKAVEEYLSVKTEFDIQEVAFDLINGMKDGKTLEEISADLNVSRSTLAKWIDEYEILKDAKSIALEKAYAWWLRQGRENLENKSFSPTLFYMNMKNRFGWRDVQELEHKGDGLKQVIQIYIPKTNDLEALPQTREVPSLPGV